MVDETASTIVVGRAYASRRRFLAGCTIASGSHELEDFRLLPDSEHGHVSQLRGCRGRDHLKLCVVLLPESVELLRALF